ncbi:Nucleolar GTP-binding protein 1 [Linum grandiflorum]
MVEELEREEAEAEAEDDEFEIDMEELAQEQKEALEKVRIPQNLLKQEHRIKKSTAENMLTVPSRAIERSRSRPGRKRERSVGDDDAAMDVDGSNKKLRLRSRPSSRMTRPITDVVPGDGYKDSAQKRKAIQIARKAVKKRNKNACRGEADRVIPTRRPKHLFSGKRGRGKTSRR